MARLPDEVWRTFTHALMWCASNRTDGAISRDDLPLIPRAMASHASALVRAGLWSVTPDGWQIDGYDLTQTTRTQLESADRARVLHRARQARYRDRKSAVPKDVTRHVTDNNTGQDRLGQDRHLRDAKNNDDELWLAGDYAAPIPGGRTRNDPT
jgi:hypothetical protein